MSFHWSHTACGLCELLSSLSRMGLFPVSFCASIAVSIALGVLWMHHSSSIHAPTEDVLVAPKLWQLWIKLCEHPCVALSEWVPTHLDQCQESFIVEPHGGGTFSFGRSCEAVFQNGCAAVLQLLPHHLASAVFWSLDRLSGRCFLWWGV